MLTDKKYSITIYLENGEKRHTDRMTYEEVFNWIRQNPKEEISIWNFDSNTSVPKSKF